MELNKSLHKQWKDDVCSILLSLINSCITQKSFEVVVLTNLKSLAFILKPLGLGGFNTLTKWKP